MKTTVLVGVVGILGILLGTPSLYSTPVPGSLEIRLSDGTTTMTIADTSADDTSSTLGQVSWSGTVGAWTVSLGAAGFPFLTDPLYLSYAATASTSGPGGGILTMQVTQTGITRLTPTDFQLLI